MFLSIGMENIDVNCMLDSTDIVFQYIFLFQETVPLSHHFLYIVRIILVLKIQTSKLNLTVNSLRFLMMQPTRTVYEQD